MGYSVIDSETGRPLPIRIIADYQPDNGAPWLCFAIMDPFTPREWTHDACARHDQRYRVEFESGAVQYFRWFEIIEPHDTPADVRVKLSGYAEFKAARLAFDRARAEFTRIAGRSPEIMKYCYGNPFGFQS